MSVRDAGNATSFPSPRTLSFADLQSTFTVLWGSVDRYNSIQFNGAGGTALSTVGGQDIADILGLPAQNRPQFDVSALVQFDADANAGLFESVTFSSTSPALEFALDSNLGTVPLPASGLMLLFGAASLAAFRQRKT